MIIEGDDLYGDGINVAARLEALAEPGGLCLSEDAQRQVRGKLDLPLVDLGERQLENISQPMRVFSLAAGDGRTSTPVGAALPSGYRRPKILLATFRPLGSGSDTAALAEGVTETLAAALAHFEEFELIDPGSVQALVAEHGARTAGQRLGATYVVEGSLQLASGKVRVGVQLVDASSGRRVWSETLDRAGDNVFALQDEVTALVASTLGEAVGEEQAKAIAEKPDSELDAYERMVRGLQHLNRLTPVDVAEARAHFERALAMAPEQYFVTLSLCWTYAAEAVPLAERALAINPYAPTFYSSHLAFVCFFAGDYEKGLAALQTVQGSVGPSRLIRIACLTALGRAGEACAEAQKILAATPDFDLDRLIERFSLASETDRTRLLDALRHAGL